MERADPSAFSPAQIAGAEPVRARSWLRRSLGVALDFTAALALVTAAVLVAGKWTEQATHESLRETGQARLDLYESTLQAGIDRYVYLPYVLSANEHVRRMLEAPEDGAAVVRANGFLQALNREAGSSALYIMSAEGLTRASSTWNADVTFVGQNYAFRPYFQDAAGGKLGRFYAIGATTGEPGYFLATPVYGGQRLLGVAAVKFRLDEVEHSWQRGPVKVAVADANGIVFLSSERDWKYQGFSALMQDAEDHLRTTRQYGDKAIRMIGIRELDEPVPGARRVLAPSKEGLLEHLVVERSVPPLGWKLIVLLELREADALKRNAQAAAGSAAAFVFLLYLYLRQRRRRIRDNMQAKAALERAYGDLEHRVAERTADLVTANKELRTMHDELVQAGKLAALGQMAASVTHELNQPLAALRTLSDNTRVFLERGQLAEARENLQTVGQLTARLGRITGQLKAFARKSSMRVSPVPLQPAVANALALAEPRIAAEGAQVSLQLPPEPLLVLCDDLGLAQILSNLLHNALDAVQGAPRREVTVSAAADGERIRLSVADSGPGFAPEALQHLLEPFFTTKEKGTGMGLGLVICAGIARECGATIAAGNRSEGGAELVVHFRKTDAG